MSAILEAQNLAYISAPKCACSSVKDLIFRVENNCNFNKLRTERGGIRFQISGRPIYLHNFYPAIPYTEQPQHLLKKLNKFCVVRNPLNRFTSCYRNRVLRFGALKAEKIAQLEIDAPSDPDLNQFVEHLDEYTKAPQIRHHKLPLTHFLGDSADSYDRIFNLKTFHQLPAYLKQHFGRTRSLRHLQTSEHERTPKTSTNALSSSSIQKLENYYSEDFRCFSQYF